MRVAACDANTGRRGGLSANPQGILGARDWGFDFSSGSRAARRWPAMGLCSAPVSLASPLPSSLSPSLSLPSRRRNKRENSGAFCFYSLCFKKYNSRFELSQTYLSLTKFIKILLTSITSNRNTKNILLQLVLIIRYHKCQ